MFERDSGARTAADREWWGFYERLYTLIDFSAAFAFVIGSVMFFDPRWQHAGTWMFLLGSLLFAAKPSVRVLREFHLARLPLPGDDGND